MSHSIPNYSVVHKKEYLSPSQKNPQTQKMNKGTDAEHEKVQVNYTFLITTT